MTRSRALLAVVFAAVTLTGCFNGGSSGGKDAVTESSFTAFVTGLFENSSDTAESVAINDREFRFDDQDNEDAFNDLIQQQ